MSCKLANNQYSIFDVEGKREEHLIPLVITSMIISILFTKIFPLTTSLSTHNEGLIYSITFISTISLWQIIKRFK